MAQKNRSANIKTKKNGQIFTPDFIVQLILDCCNYNGDNVLKKHVMDNSCGDGAFLRAIVRIYIETAREMGLGNESIKADLEAYIHGVDNDKVAFDSCIEKLSAVAAEYGISNVRWDLYNTSALSMNRFNGKMDYVVGNPPYVRVHNLDSTYDEVKTYTFANGGMTDLYLAFFELGFNMLKPDGQLCYITPSSWLNSLAAENMRRHILQHRNLVALIDLAHFQPFENVTAYTVISHFKQSHDNNQFDYYRYDEDTGEKDFRERLNLKDIHIDSCFYLSDSARLEMIHKIKTSRLVQYVSVKNGFATLADAVFIGDNIPESPITIKALKASTGKWYKCLFPYDKRGKSLPEDQVLANNGVKRYLLANKERLLKGKPEHKGWYLYGRTQALADVFRPKLSVNTLVRTKSDFKLTELKSGEGIYSGLYVITDYEIDFQTIKNLIASDNCIEYVKTLKKYKSGGYYTFNSKDLEQYINYNLTYNHNI